MANFGKRINRKTADSDIGTKTESGGTDNGTVIESKPIGDSISQSGVDGEPIIIEGIETADPDTSGTSDTGTADTIKRRGRPKGSKNASKTSDAVEGLTGILLNVHAMLSVLVKCPELVIEESEAKKLSKAITQVAEFYPVELAPKVVAWVNLTICCGAIYGTRVIAISNRLKNAPKEKPRMAVLPAANSFAGKPNGAPQPEAQKQSRIFSPSQLNNRPPSDND
jgi:hypothetical protein